MAVNTNPPAKSNPQQPGGQPYVAPTADGIGFQTNPQYGGDGPTQSITGVPTQNLGVVPGNKRPT